MKKLNTISLQLMSQRHCINWNLNQILQIQHHQVLHLFLEVTLCLLTFVDARCKIYSGIWWTPGTFVYCWLWHHVMSFLGWSLISSASMYILMKIVTLFFCMRYARVTWGYCQIHLLIDWLNIVDYSWWYSTMLQM